MCELLSLFVVIGAVQISPDAMLVQIVNNDVLEQYIVPKEQYMKCKVSEKVVEIWVQPYQSN